MAGHAVESVLSGLPARETLRGPARAAADEERFVFGVAEPADDPEIRRLLRENPFDGDVRVSLEREPDSALAASIEGERHQTLIARDAKSSRAVAMGSRSIRAVFVNGEAMRVSYLGQLRIDRASRRSRRLLADGFAFCRTLHEIDPTPFTLASIIEDNRAARRLVEARLHRWPVFVPLEPLVTFMIPVGARPARDGATRSNQISPGGGRIERGAPELLGEITECLARNGRRFQFAPAWTVGDLASPERVRGLALEDFFVARRGAKVVGCVALWDQRAFKQAIVRGYAARLARWRPLTNLMGPPLGIPRLPRVGAPLEFAYLSHVAIDDDDQDVLGALVSAAGHAAAAGRLDYLVTAFAARNPLCTAIAHRVAHLTYRSVLYLVGWDGMEDVMAALDGRVPHVEAAIL